MSYKHNANTRSPFAGGKYAIFLELDIQMVKLRSREFKTPQAKIIYKVLTLEQH